MLFRSTANSFHTDSSGNSWWGATTIGSANAKILNTGVATFANINITGGTGVANLTDAGALAVLNTVGTAQIDALAVTSAKVADSAITTTQIATDAVTQAQIAVGAVGSNELSAGAVIAGKITAGTIVASDIATGTITSNEIAANTIVAGNIAAGTITANEMTVSQLSAINANMGILTAGKIEIGGIEVNADTEQILFGSATAPLVGTGIFLGKSGANYEFRAGNPSQDYFYYDGQDLFISGIINFNKSVFIGNYNDGLTETVTGSGAIIRDLLLTQLQDQASGYAKLESRSSGIDYPWVDSVFTGVIDFFVRTVFFPATPTGTRGGNIAFLGLVDDTVAITTSSTTETNKHIGFYIENDPTSSGAIYITCTNADGTTQTTTEVNTTPNPSTMSLRIRNVANQIQFYVNNSLIATHTTNMPSGTYYNIQMVIAWNAGTDSGALRIDNSYRLAVNNIWS